MDAGTIMDKPCLNQLLMHFGGEINTMRKLWCYIFYFTWQMYISMDKSCIDRPIDFLCRLFPFLNKYKAKAAVSYKDVMNDLENGYNIFFSYRWMLLTTTIIIANVEIIVFYSFDSSLIDVLDLIFSIKLDQRINFIAFFLSSLILSYWVNELFLQWGIRGYIKYFKEFERENRKIGFLSASVFHFGTIFICIFLVLIFNI